MPPTLSAVLQEADNEAAKEWIERRYKGCPNCRSKRVKQQGIACLHTMEHGKLDDGKPILTWNENLLTPVLHLKCEDCDYVSLFTASELLKQLGKM